MTDRPAIARPELGDPLPLAASPQTLALLARRRSSSSQTLAAPGPDAAQLERLLTLGARVPDHGKLAPWRFLIIEAARKPVLIERLKSIAAARPDAERASAKLGKLAAAPLTITVISRANPEAEIPLWEQELSAGAVCMNLLTAAAAMGFGANWITDWYAYDAQARPIFGLEPNERIAGFVHVGTPPEAPLERARPDVASLTSDWTG